MKALKKRKIREAIARRTKEVEKYQVNKAWRNIFVQTGILKWMPTEYSPARKLEDTNSLKQQLKLF